MSRYIDADALKNKLQQHHDFFVNAWDGFREMPIQDKVRCDELSNSIAEIFNAPSIDIVFCNECKFENTRKCPPHRMGLIHDASDYCSYGIRKE